MPKLIPASSLPALVFLLLVAGAARADRPPVEEVVRKMQAFYEKTKDLKGKFKQVYTDRLYASHRTSYGYVYVKKPGMMRWNYVKPERQSFIADGKTLWFWEPEVQQVFRNPLDSSSLSTGLTFLLGKGDLSKEFSISYSDEKLGAPGDLVLKLLPHKPTAQYEYLLFVIRPDDYSVGETMVVGRETRNHLIFTELKLDTRLSNGRFSFTPPAGARIIDGSKMRPRP